MSAGRHGPKRVVGQPLSGKLPNAAAGLPLQITEPDGHTDDLHVSVDAGGGRWSFADTWQSGIYLVRVGQHARREELFVVNVDTAEGDLAQVDPADLPSQFTAAVRRRDRRRGDCVGPAQPFE